MAQAFETTAFEATAFEAGSAGTSLQCPTPTALTLAALAPALVVALACPAPTALAFTKPVPSLAVGLGVPTAGMSFTALAPTLTQGVSLQCPAPTAMAFTKPAPTLATALAVPTAALSFTQPVPSLALGLACPAPVALSFTQPPTSLAVALAAPSATMAFTALAPGLSSELTATIGPPRTLLLPARALAITPHARALALALPPRALGIVLPVRALSIKPDPSGGPMLQFTPAMPKAPGEGLPLVMDFAQEGWLQPEETLQSCVWTAQVYEGPTGNPYDLAVDPTPNAMISGAATVAGTKTTQLVVGGLEGVVYLFIATATLSSGRVTIVRGILRVALAA